MILLKEYIVYKVISPKGKVYIGITSKSLKERKRLHFNEARHSTYKFHNALNKYEDSMCWDVIDNSAQSWEELKELEKYYIQLFNSCKNGYNSTLGGDGTLGHEHSEESKIKMRGKRPQTSKALKGIKKTESHKKALSEARKSLNIKYSKEEKEILALKNGAKKFEVFKDNIKIGEWINKKECARDLNFTSERGIVGCLNQPTKFKIHKGYVFKYCERGVPF